MRRHSSSGLATGLAAGVISTLLAYPASVQADGLRLYATVGGGLLISSDQLGYLGYDQVGGRSALAVGYAVSDLVVLEGHGAAAIFGSSAGAGSLFEVGAGVRLEIPVLLRGARWSPALHIDLGITGGEMRPALDLTSPLFFDLSSSWAIGPMLQYGRVIQPDGERYSTDAQYFTAGIALAYRTPPPEPPAAERPHSSELRFQREVVREPSTPPPSVEPSPEVLVLIEKATGPLGSEVDLIPPVLFEFDSVELIPCGEAALYYARDAIHQHRGSVVLEGHADATGDAPYNVDLARRRAEHVRDWLVRHGVKSERLRVETFGETTRLAKETNDSQRQINRRVIIRLLEEKP